MPGSGLGDPILVFALFFLAVAAVVEVSTGLGRYLIGRVIRLPGARPTRLWLPGVSCDGKPSCALPLSLWVSDEVLRVRYGGLHVLAQVPVASIVAVRFYESHDWYRRGPCVAIVCRDESGQTTEPIVFSVPYAVPLVRIWERLCDLGFPGEVVEHYPPRPR